MTTIWVLKYCLPQPQVTFYSQTDYPHWQAFWYLTLLTCVCDGGATGNWWWLTTLIGATELWGPAFWATWPLQCISGIPVCGADLPDKKTFPVVIIGAIPLFGIIRCGVWAIEPHYWTGYAGALLMTHCWRRPIILNPDSIVYWYCNID